MKKLKNLAFIVIAVYAVLTFTNQEKILNSYREQKTEIANQIEDAEEQKQQLTISKENANSLEYIEQIAREKLNMYYPNERIYVDNSTKIKRFYLLVFYSKFKASKFKIQDQLVTEKCLRKWKNLKFDFTKHKNYVIIKNIIIYQINLYLEIFQKINKLYII